MIKQFLKPEPKKIVLFLISFLIAFFELPFLKLPTGKTESIFLLIKNYSGSKQDFYTLLFGIILYIIAFYFISCTIILLWDNFRSKKSSNKSR